MSMQGVSNGSGAVAGVPLKEVQEGCGERIWDLNLAACMYMRPL